MTSILVQDAYGELSKETRDKLALLLNERIPVMLSVPGREMGLHNFSLLFPKYHEHCSESNHDIVVRIEINSPQTDEELQWSADEISQLLSSELDGKAVGVRITRERGVWAKSLGASGRCS